MQSAYIIRSCALIAILLIFVVAGCDSSSSSNAKTGRFVDSPVSNLKYTTPTRSGLTDADGRYRYREGEVVTFWVADQVLGSSRGAEYTTPLDLRGTLFADDESVANMARLIQTLDQDQNPDNGIQLPDFTDTEEYPLEDGLDFYDEDGLAEFVEHLDVGYEGPYLISEEAALSHLEQTLENLPPLEIPPGQTMSYELITIGHEYRASDQPDPDSCTEWTGVTLETTSFIDDLSEPGTPPTETHKIQFTGTLTGSQGESDSFDLNGTTRFNGGVAYGTTANGTFIRVGLEMPAINFGDVRRAEILLGGTISRGGDGCPTRFYLKAPDAPVLKPAAAVGTGMIHTIAGCPDNMSSSWRMHAWSPNGYLADTPDFSVTSPDGTPVTSVTPVLHDDQPLYLLVWEDKPPQRTDIVQVSGLPCGASYTWEYTVIDNTGQTYTATGVHGSSSGETDNGAQSFSLGQTVTGSLGPWSERVYSVNVPAGYTSLTLSGSVSDPGDVDITGFSPLNTTFDPNNTSSWTSTCGISMWDGGSDEDPYCDEWTESEGVHAPAGTWYFLVGTWDITSTYTFTVTGNTQ